MALDPLSQQTVDLLAGAVTAKQNIITALRNKEAVVPDNARLADLPPIIDGIETEPDDFRQFMIDKSHGGGLIAGNLDCGYCGSIAGSDMGTFDDNPVTGLPVNGTNLTNACGLAGSANKGNLLTEDLIFHKFIFRGEVILIPQKPIRSGFAYNNIGAYGLITGGKVVKIDNRKYKITLLRAAREVSGTLPDLSNPANNFYFSEWWKLVCPLLANHEEGWGTNLTANDLGMQSGIGYKTITNSRIGWVSPDILTCHGADGKELSAHSPSANSAGVEDLGWRPALRFTL